jgi:hypothetical protein
MSQGIGGQFGASLFGEGDEGGVQDIDGIAVGGSATSAFVVYQLIPSAAAVGLAGVLSALSCSMLCVARAQVVSESVAHGALTILRVVQQAAAFGVSTVRVSITRCVSRGGVATGSEAAIGKVVKCISEAALASSSSSVQALVRRRRSVVASAVGVATTFTSIWKRVWLRANKAVASSTAFSDSVLLVRRRKVSGQLLGVGVGVARASIVNAAIRSTAAAFSVTSSRVVRITSRVGIAAGNACFGGNVIVRASLYGAAIGTAIAEAALLIVVSGLHGVDAPGVGGLFGETLFGEGSAVLGGVASGLAQAFAFVTMLSPLRSVAGGKSSAVAFVVGLCHLVGSSLSLSTAAVTVIRVVTRLQGVGHGFATATSTVIRVVSGTFTRGVAAGVSSCSSFLSRLSLSAGIAIGQGGSQAVLWFVVVHGIFGRMSLRVSSRGKLDHILQPVAGYAVDLEHATSIRVRKGSSVAMR